LQLAGQFRENAEVRPLLKDVVDLVKNRRRASCVRKRYVAACEFQKCLD
jgi:hypothetical protein